MSARPKPLEKKMPRTPVAKPAENGLGKSLHETFRAFFEDPSRDKLRAMLRDAGGELRQLDFKADWPKSGALSKHVLAMGNSGGGCLVIGVEEGTAKTLEPSGLAAFKDSADVINGVKRTIPDALLAQVRVLSFHYEASDWGKLVGRKFQVVLVEPDSDQLPYVAVNNGEELQAGVVYVRREGGTMPASHEELQRLINARIEGGRSTAAEMHLKDHLDQLKTLYDEIPRTRASLLLSLAATGNLFGHKSERNPRFPAEDYDAFIVKLIERKKRRITVELDVTSE